MTVHILAALLYYKNNKDIFGFNDNGFKDSTFNDKGVVIGTAAVCGCGVFEDDEDYDDNNNDNGRLAVCGGVFDKGVVVGTVAVCGGGVIDDNDVILEV